MKGVDTADGITECIIHALISGSESTFEEMVRDQSEDTTLNDLIRKAAMTQDTIGWHNFCRGRIAKEWRLAQDYFLNKVSDGRKRSSKSWSKIFLVKIYHMVHDIWEFRNSVVTKVTQEKASMSERNKMAKEVRKQFEMGCSTLRPKDHYLLECTLDSVLQKIVKFQRYWVRKCIVSR